MIFCLITLLLFTIYPYKLLMFIFDIFYITFCKKCQENIVYFANIEYFYLQLKAG